MRLSAMLAQPGGISEQGREIRLRLRTTGADRVPCFHDITGVLLPLSEPEIVSVRKTALETAAAADAPLPYGQEEIVRLLELSLRDPQNPADRLIQGVLDLKALRDGLVAPQYEYILGEYDKLMEEQYPDEITAQQEARLKRQARDFSASDQPARG